MALPTLESITPKLDRVCADVLGETIQYAADGVVFSGVQAHVDYRDGEQDIGAGEIIEQKIVVEAVMLDMPLKPTSAARCRLARCPGKTFKPINPNSDKSRTHWVFSVESV